VIDLPGGPEAASPQHGNAGFAGGVAQADAWLERSSEVHKDPLLEGVCVLMTNPGWAAMPLFNLPVSTSL
jgi:hypothetical protein